MSKLLKLLLLALALMVSGLGCSVVEEGQSTAAPVPTSHPFFGGIEEADELDPLGADLQSTAAVSSVEPTAEVAGPEAGSLGTAAADGPSGDGPSPSGTSNSAAMPETPAAPGLEPAEQLAGGQPISGTNFYTVTVFDERLNENWSIGNSQWVTTTVNGETAYQGKYSMAWQPYEDFATIFFTVERDDEVLYLRSQVVGIRFWLSGGESWIERDDLAITAIGSNQYPYWAPIDYSVRSRIQPTFSETRLEFLNLNRDIPPGEWAPIVLILNDLQFDPPYQYVTGFYLKNDRGVLYPIYLDNVELIMVREENDSES